VTKALTDRYIAGLRGRPDKLNVFDRHTRGLVLRVGVRTKTWFFSYRNGGATQWLKLGEYPSLKLADARDRAEEQRGLLGQHLDPVKEREKARTPPEPPPTAPVFTFADFVPIFVQAQRDSGVETWEKQESNIKRYLLPAWGPLPLRDIGRAQIADLLDTVAGKGLSVGVNRLQALISRIFTIALDRGKVDAHPAARMLKRFEERPRDRVLTDAEVRALWSGLDAQPGAASDAIRLRLLLGQRGEETAGMLWSEIDLDIAHWSLPAERTKTGRPHVLALPSLALAIIKRRRKLVADDEPHVFPDLSLGGGDHRALGTLHGGSYTWKDLRRTCRTRLAELGFSEEVADRVLNHAQKSTVSRRHYNQHRYLPEITQALEAWDRELKRILANEPKSKKVVSIRRRR